MGIYGDFSVINLGSGDSIAFTPSIIDRFNPMRHMIRVAAAALFSAIVAIAAIAGPASAQTAPADGEWAGFGPGTELGPKLATSAELGSSVCQLLGGCPTAVNAWTSFAYAKSERQIWAINLGGHADWGGTDSYVFDLDTPALGWVRSSPVIFPFTGAIDARGCQLPDGNTPGAQHTYDGVVWTGGLSFFWLGDPAFCKGAYAVDRRTAFFVDVSTTPFTWTRVAQLDTYGGPVATGLYQDWIVLVDDQGRYAKFSKTTGAFAVDGAGNPVKGQIKAAKVNGATLPATLVFNAQMGSGDVNPQGILLLASEASLTCLDANGTNPDADNDTRFGRAARHPFPAGVTAGVKNAVTALPDGRFALWQGGKKIWIGTIDCFNAANDAWVAHDPATGPTASSTLIYQKMFWDDELCVLIGAANSAENPWMFRVPDVCRTEEEPDDEEPGGETGEPQEPEQPQNPDAPTDPDEPGDPACASSMPALIRTHHDKIPNFATAATICSVRGGNWSDPSIWSGGRVPGPADIVIARHNIIGAGIDVDTLAIESGATRLQGRVGFANIQVTAAGHLLIDDPAELVCKPKPIDLSVDPSQYGTGIQVIDGAVTIRGAEKTAFLRLATAPRAGDATLLLEAAPNGWQPGDRLVVPDTRAARTGGSQSETPIVQSVAGNIVTLVAPLQFDHAGTGNLLPHTGNLTRSIVIRSADPNGLRCHILITGRAAADIAYAELRDLGRTKSAPLDSTSFDGDGNLVRIGANQIGRYPLHLHHLIGPVVPLPSGHQFDVAGVAVADSPKWAIAIHNSHFGRVADSVTYDTDGAAIVTEDGAESGNLIDHNFAARCDGHGDGLTEREAKSGIGVDIGFEGSCFWFRAQRNAITNNVAADAPVAGFMVFPRAGHVGKALMRDVPLRQGDDPMMAGQSMDVRAAAPVAFDNNETYATSRGFEFWYAKVAVMTRSRAWHIKNTGLFLQYHGSALVDGLTIDGADEALVGQHGNSLDLRDAEIDSARVMMRMESNKRGIRFDNVRRDGVAQASPAYAPILDMLPAADSQVSGVVTITFPGIAAGKIVINVDGKKLATDSKAPYAVTWDTTKAANGTHWITAEFGADAAYASQRVFVAN